MLHLERFVAVAVVAWGGCVLAQVAPDPVFEPATAESQGVPAEAIAALDELGLAAVRAHELELWLLRCDANLRKPALTLVPKFEFHHDNRSAWPVLLDGHTRADETVVSV